MVLALLASVDRWCLVDQMVFARSGSTICLWLGISAWTVHGHVKNIFEKLNVHTRTEAVVKLLQK